MLSRFLWGGRSVFAAGVAATALGVALGIAVGLVAAYSRVAARRLPDARDGRDPRASRRSCSCWSPSRPSARACGCSCSRRLHARCRASARVTRGAALEVVERDFVRAAEAIGESRVRILLGEILPNITEPAARSRRPALTYAIGLIAGLSFLGFGLQPPAADWGLMINENRSGITAAVGRRVPVLAIALLTIGDEPGRRRHSRAAVSGIDRGKE